MPRDLPDWDALTAQATVYEVTDLGELAARLGSIDTFDRRGDVIWLETFETGLHHWLSFTSGTGAHIGLTTTRTHSGAFAARLTAGEDGGRYAQVQHAATIPAISPLGVEFAFHLVGSLYDIEVQLVLLDGTNQLVWAVHFDRVNSRLTYEDSGGSEVAFATGVVLSTGSTIFHVAKLVVAPATEGYVRFILDNTEYSLSGIAGAVSPSGAAGLLIVTITLTGRPGLNDEVYLDDVILTQNEPT